MDVVCRLCSRQAKSFESIFNFKNGRLILDLIQLIIPVKIDINDSFPKKICSSCIDVVTKASELRETSIKADISFKTGTFQVLPELPPEIPSLQTRIKIEPNDSDDECSPYENLSKKQKTTNSCNCSKNVIGFQTNVKLGVIDQKIDMCLASLLKFERVNMRMGQIEKQVVENEREFQSKFPAKHNYIETVIGIKPPSFPTNLRASTLEELAEIDRILSDHANSEYFKKYLLNIIGKNPDYRSFMKRAMEVVMSNNLKATLSFANHIRNLQAYNLSTEICSLKFAVSKKEIETYVSRNIANLKNYKRNKNELPEASNHNASQSSISVEGSDVRGDVYFEVMELN